MFISQLEVDDETTKENSYQSFHYRIGGNGHLDLSAAAR